MPIYEYECEACGHRFERIQKFSDALVEECPSCGERKVQKLLSSPAIKFKGTGWYITDYARKGATGSDTKSSGSSDGSKESKESRESKESKESTESKESKQSKDSTESKSPTPASGTTGAAKASGE